MGVTEVAYLVLLVVVGALRLVEIWISRRNQRYLAAQGVAKVPELHFRWMVVFHTGILVSAGLEVVLLHRPFFPLLASVMGVLFILANGLRFWVIRTMSWHWNVEIMSSTRLGVVSGGPFRWIRHPNYLGVFTEMIALPLIHTAWLTALVGSALHVLILRRRIRTEESVLLADPEYRAVMGSKPRFLPRFS